MGQNRVFTEKRGWHFYEHVLVEETGRKGVMNVQPTVCGPCTQGVKDVS
jgi:hypothetical protein